MARRMQTDEHQRMNPPMQRKKASPEQPAEAGSPRSARGTRTARAAPAAQRGASIEVEGRLLHLSNLDKVLYPKSGFSKGAVIDYYARIAPTILPYLKGRPLTLKRYPNGVEEGFFYEKMCPSHRPDWVRTTRVPSSNERKYIQYCLVDDAATLIWVANLASLELHTLLSTVEDVMRPSFMVFDHDPGPGADILDCIRIALRFHGMLKHMGLESFAKTSGGKGLHLYIPLNTAVTFEETKTLSRAMAQLLEQDDPQHVTSNMRKDLRAGKVFIDWSQNDDHKTTVTAYSLRARERPTVSAPVSWEELDAALKQRDAGRLVFESAQVLERVEKLGDLFAPVLRLRQNLPKL